MFLFRVVHFALIERNEGNKCKFMKGKNKIILNYYLFFDGYSYINLYCLTVIFSLSMHLIFNHKIIFSTILVSLLNFYIPNFLQLFLDTFLMSSSTGSSTGFIEYYYIKVWKIKYYIPDEFKSNITVFQQSLIAAKNLFD